MTKTDLVGKVAVVTGSSRGIGRAIAIRLGARGAQVVVNYAHGAQGAAETVAAVVAAGSDAVAVQANVIDVRERYERGETILRREQTHDLSCDRAG